MSGVRHQDLGAGQVVAGAVIGADHGHACELALGTGGGGQGDGVHPGDLLQHLLEFEETGEEALAVGLRGRRVAGQKARQ